LQHTKKATGWKTRQIAELEDKLVFSVADYIPQGGLCPPCGETAVRERSEQAISSYITSWKNQRRQRRRRFFTKREDFVFTLSNWLETQPIALNIQYPP